MPRRDPKTGKFVSGSGGEYPRDRIFGSIASTVPAADLAGGTTDANVFGEDSEVIDFSEYLDSDEVFEIAAVTVTATLAMPTTATAEGAAQLNWSVASDLGKGRVIAPTHYGGNTMRESETADIRQAQWDDDTVITQGTMTATAGFGDSVNGLGAGSFDGYERERIAFWDEYGSGPIYDADDELSVPHTMYIDNVSDHAVVAEIVVFLEGEVHDT